MYQSPFSWRYGSSGMRRLWSEARKRALWRRVWVALARAECAAGLVKTEQVADLEAHASEVNLERSLAIEAEIHHDLMAEIKAFAEQSPVGGGIIHLGATSADIEDNADALRLREACDLVLERLAVLLAEMAAKIELWASMPAMGLTHLQPAEPTTIGYRLAQYGQDLLVDLDELRRVRRGIRGKGFKGAVGTSASYLALAGAGNTIEADAMRDLGIEAWPVATQTYPRKQDWLVVCALAGLAGSLHKFALDLRLLQSPYVGEWSEPFGDKQVGSSAMPFKRNPVSAEKVDSLARYLAQLPRIAWDNAAQSMLERTLDDSASRRVVLPEGFLCADEMLITVTRLVKGLKVDTVAAAVNLATYGSFAATERLLMAAVAAGADRQAMHEVIRQHSMDAWARPPEDRAEALMQNLEIDGRVTRWVRRDRVRPLLDAMGYVGDAPERAMRLAAEIRRALAA